MPRAPQPDQEPKFYFSPARDNMRFVAIAIPHLPKGDEWSLLFPQRLLLGFSLELYLKAWLRLQGTSSDDLQFKYGHNIDLLFEDAKSAGLPEPSRYHDVVSQISPQHRDYGNRYPKDGSYYVAMDYMYVAWVLACLDETVAEHIPNVTKGHGIDFRQLSPGAKILR